MNGPLYEVRGTAGVASRMLMYWVKITLFTVLVLLFLFFFLFRFNNAVVETSDNLFLISPTNYDLDIHFRAVSSNNSSNQVCLMTKGHWTS